ncbi:uncharacterized protein N7484_004365 [Penicillium longicatenatum]|uniref:uncharacterized protein n=1 Tax=Penicillium longicatenatum TaxID=1561947 RepID=UPI0025486D78|nr:uncharacterized protein N7484_004365 [Penicillium longicatenatum]KAJ5650642.1 hypothetical protein N7484_004365 [Penicillium longicatenatum]
MADPLSIASGVAGLLSLGIQVTQSLVDFYSAFKHQTSDIAKITQSLESLLAIFRSLGGALQDRQPGTDALLQEIMKSTQGCHAIIKELQAECQKFQKTSAAGYTSRIKFFGRQATYPFRKSTLQKLEEDIEEIQDRLSLALNVLQLKNQNRLDDGMSDLKSLLKSTAANQISSTICEWLQAPDASINHNDICPKRHTGTGLWFIQSPHFQDWLVKRKSFLWINGFAGSGKSVLCSTAIQHMLHEKNNRQNGVDVTIGVGYFYFSFNDESKQDISGMLRALLVQLLAQLYHCEESLEKLHALYRHSSPPVDALLDCLRKIISRFSETYLLIDALDESPRDTKRDSVLSAINAMQQWGLPGLHLLVTSRDEVDIRQALAISDDQDISMKNVEIDKDIVNFVSYQLNNDPKLQKWKERHSEIQDRLTEKAQGVFRYIECQFLALKRARNRNQLDECLTSLPRDLDGTYQRILCSIDEEHIEDVRRFLTVLCVSNRPLTIKELIHAHAVDLREPPHLDHGRIYEEEDDLVEVCRGLIELSTVEDDTGLEVRIARIAHFSVQEYLESERVVRSEAAKFAIRKELANTEMAQILLVYLLEPMLSDGVLDMAKLEEFPLAHFAAMQWFHHYGSPCQDLVLRLFAGKTDSFVTWVRLHDLDRPWNTSVEFERAVEDIPLPLYYTALLGLHDVLSALIANLGDEASISDAVHATGGKWNNALLAAASQGHEKVVKILLDRGADVNLRVGGTNPILEASSKGHQSVVQMLVDHGVDVNCRGGRDGNALLMASTYGYKEVVQILLDNGADANDSGERYCHALVAASSKGHDTIIQCLLDHGADINARDGLYGSSCDALQAAVLKDHRKVVQVLLDRGADVNRLIGRDGNALQVASSKGHEELVRLLLDHGADVNSQCGHFGNALQAAVFHGHEKVVNILLDHGADIHSLGGAYTNALVAAASSGHEKILQMLIDQGADIHFESELFGDSLQAAAYGGQENMVQSLLDRGANVNAQGGTFGNALQAASHKGCTKIVQNLLSHGANPKAQGGSFGTALQAACVRNSEEIVRILLDLGVDINASSPKFGSALEVASSEGHEGLVQMLLDEGADVNAQGGVYGNALQFASAYGHEKVVHILLNRGADVNAQGGRYGTALLAALAKDQGRVVEILLDRGADIKPIL